MKIIYLIVIILSTIFSSYSQKSIDFKIESEKGYPINNCQISLIKSKTGEIIEETTSIKNGQFKLSKSNDKKFDISVKCNNMVYLDTVFSEFPNQYLSIRINTHIEDSISDLNETALSYQDYYNNNEWKEIDARYNKTFSDEIIINTIEIDSIIKGGKQIISKHIRENISYPQRAVDLDVSGQVLVQFIIEPDGNISHVKAIKRVDLLLDKEAIRVMRKLSKIKPSLIKDKNSRHIITTPINFKLG
jgi:TonB family protein